MKLLILGATGLIGRCVARKALQLGPAVTVTIFVRSQTKLEKILGTECLKDAKIVEGSIEDSKALAAVMKGQEACICTAGHAVNSRRADFQELFKSVVEAAAKYLEGPKRLWMMAGITLMSLPGSNPNVLINDLPIFSLLPYTVHSPNFAVMQDLGGSLDWSLMCSGILHPQQDADLKHKTKAFAGVAPIYVPQFLSNWRLLHLFASVFVLAQLSKFNNTLEATAEFMIQNLEGDGLYKGKRLTLVQS